MSQEIKIGVIGEFNPSTPSHPPTNAAIDHAAEGLGIRVQAKWIGTEAWTDSKRLNELEGYDGLWAAPGSPYKSLEGALMAIRCARERGIPFTGT